jgi:hypothetical protein
MNLIRKFFLAAAVTSLSALHAHATPVSVSTFSFAPGSGYGVDASENSGTALDVLFTSTFAPQNFTLNAAGEFLTFNVGTIEFREPNSHSGIVINETDNLDVAANLTFASPFGSLIQVSATGTAATGSVSDSAADLSIDWSPVQVAFGIGGLLGISLNDLTFNGLQTLTQTATITLVNVPYVPNLAAPGNVPEPATLALLGLGLAGMGYQRRKRAA